MVRLVNTPPPIPILVMLSGLPGSGKSTVARALRDAMPQHAFTIIASDRVRKELFPNPSYSDEEHKVTHETVHQRLLALLKQGRNVIHDATNLQDTFRDWRHEAVRQTGCRVLLVNVALDDAETRRRIVARAQTATSISDADLAVYDLLRTHREPIQSPHATVHTDDRFDTDLAATTSQIEALLANTTPVQPRRKVMCYITSGRKLLVFRQPQHPEAGIQVPGGSVEDGEAWDAAAAREAFEETGLANLNFIGCLGEAWRDMSDYGKNQIHQRRFYHFSVEAIAQERWQHWEAFSGDGQRVLFELFWVTLDDVPQLIAEQGAMLGQLAESATSKSVTMSA